jgi:hypothetical protein
MENLLLMPLLNPAPLNYCGPSLKLRKSLVSSHPAHLFLLPSPTFYYNPVVNQKYNSDGSVKFRVRGTAGGNLLHVPYDVSAHCQPRCRETSAPLCRL